jgi:hypothetical protein
MVDSQRIESPDPMKHCQVDDIKICTRCGSTNVKIERDTIYCNDCNVILCFEHKK